MQQWHGAYDARVEREGLVLKTGLVELLDWLEARAIPRAVATSTRRARARHKLEQYRPVAALRGAGRRRRGRARQARPRHLPQGGAASRRSAGAVPGPRGFARPACTRRRPRASPRSWCRTSRRPPRRSRAPRAAGDGHAPRGPRLARGRRRPNDRAIIARGPAIAALRSPTSDARMIGRLTGILVAKNPPQILLDVHGVAYEVDVPMSTFYNLPGTGEEVDAAHAPRRARGRAPALRLRQRAGARGVPPAAQDHGDRRAHGALGAVGALAWPTSRRRSRCRRRDA